MINRNETADILAALEDGDHVVLTTANKFATFHSEYTVAKESACNSGGQPEFWYLRPCNPANTSFGPFSRLEELKKSFEFLLDTHPDFSIEKGSGERLLLASEYEEERHA